MLNTFHLDASEDVERGSPATPDAEAAARFAEYMPYEPQEVVAGAPPEEPGPHAGRSCGTPGREAPLTPRSCTTHRGPRKGPPGARLGVPPAGPSHVEIAMAKDKD